MPIITVEHLSVAGVSIPNLVRQRFQSEIDQQPAQARNLPVVIDTLEFQEGQMPATHY